MYGFVNHALELLVIRNYGPEVWEDIKSPRSARRRLSWPRGPGPDTLPRCPVLSAPQRPPAVLEGTLASGQR